MTSWNTAAGSARAAGVHSDPRTDKWFQDPNVTAQEAAKILKVRLERFGPQSALHCRTPCLVFDLLGSHHHLQGVMQNPET